MKQKLIILSIMIISMTMMQSCYEYDPLCYDHDDHASVYDVEFSLSYEQRWHYLVDGGTDWEKIWDYTKYGILYEDLNPDLPSGVSAMIYTDSQNYEHNMDANGTRTTLSKGIYQIIFYNNDTEYIVFNNLGDVMTAEVTTNTRNRSYAVSKSESSTTVSAPDMLYGACVLDFESLGSGASQTLEVEMKPLVFKYLIRYIFDEGADLLTNAEGTLSGMAGGVSLSTGETSSDEVAIVFDAELKDWGVQATVMSFGIPGYPNENYSRADAGTYTLTLDLRMENGNLLSLEFDVTDQVAAHPLGGVIEVDGISIDLGQGINENSAFNVGVDDWTSWQDIPL